MRSSTEAAAASTAAAIMAILLSAALAVLVEGKDRAIAEVRPCYDTTDGSAVPLHRCLGGNEGGVRQMLDPFLVFDAYRAGDLPRAKAGKARGFPAHAHRGFTELRYVLSGGISHKDSCGNTGFTRPGGVQLFFAGRGAAHEENITTARELAAPPAGTFDGGAAAMPRPAPTDPRTKLPYHPAAWAAVDPQFFFEGFQVWVNTPAAGKDAPPRHRVVQHAEFPVYRPADTKPFNAPLTYTPPPYAVVKVLAGTFGGLEGPLTTDVPGLLFLDVVRLQPTALEKLIVAVPSASQHVLIYVYRGTVTVVSESEPDASQDLDEGEFAPLTPGLTVRLHAGTTAQGSVQAASCLVLTAPRTKEPVFVGSGFAMASREALDAARRDLEEGRAADCGGAKKAANTEGTPAAAATGGDAEL